MWSPWLSVDILINGKEDGDELNHRQSALSRDERS